jgi:hypothetical protein
MTAVRIDGGQGERRRLVICEHKPHTARRNGRPRDEGGEVGQAEAGFGGGKAGLAVGEAQAAGDRNLPGGVLRPEAPARSTTLRIAPPRAALTYSSPCRRTIGTSFATTSRIMPPNVPVATPATRTIGQDAPTSRATVTPAAVATARATASSQSTAR